MSFDMLLKSLRSKTELQTPLKSYQRQLLSNAQSLSPVDTGEFRDSWVVEVDHSSGNYTITLRNTSSHAMYANKLLTPPVSEQAVTRTESYLQSLLLRT